MLHSNTSNLFRTHWDDLFIVVSEYVIICDYNFLLSIIIIEQILNVNQNNNS